MKEIIIERIRKNEGDIVFPHASFSIDVDNWNYPARVKASMGMSYDADHLYLRYEVAEMNTKAVCTSINGPVWEDSCVEFFIAFDDAGYYNLEFNCIGNVLLGFGKNKETRQALDERLIRNIQTFPSLGKDAIDIVETSTKWNIDIIIPKSIFTENDIEFCEGKQFKGNFYKCGDKQKEPHFLSWNAIENNTPNFHLPSFFGLIKLQ